jgi:uncharacterized protein YjbI with pentapeptide repeats
VRATSENATALLTLVEAPGGRPRGASVAIHRLLGAIAHSLSVERREGRRLVKLLGGNVPLAPRRGQVEQMIRRVLRDPWLAVTAQRASALGLGRRALIALLRRGIPAARAVEDASDLEALLGSDFDKVQRGAHAAASGPCTSDTDCRGATFSGHDCLTTSRDAGRAVDMTGATFDGCDLSNLDLSKWTLQSARFINGATLDGATLTFAPLANFAGVDLSGANLAGADLRGARFNSAILTGATATSANFTSYGGFNATDFTNASLDYADLRFARFTGARLSLDWVLTLAGARLNWADLSGTSLWKESLDTNSPKLDGVVACMANVYYLQYHQVSIYPTGGVRCPSTTATTATASRPFTVTGMLRLVSARRVKPNGDGDYVVRGPVTSLRLGPGVATYSSTVSRGAVHGSVVVKFRRGVVRATMHGHFTLAPQGQVAGHTSGTGRIIGGTGPYANAAGRFSFTGTSYIDASMKMTIKGSVWPRRRSATPVAMSRRVSSTAGKS